MPVHEQSEFISAEVYSYRPPSGVRDGKWKILNFDVYMHLESCILIPFWAIFTKVSKLMKLHMNNVSQEEASHFNREDRQLTSDIKIFKCQLTFYEHFMTSKFQIRKVIFSL